MPVAFRCFMPVPLIPVTGYALQRTAKQRAGAEAFGAPMPESPEPHETHCCLRKLRASILIGRRAKDESERHWISHLERFPCSGELAGQLDIDTIFTVAGKIRLRGKYRPQPRFRYE